MVTYNSIHDLMHDVYVQGGKLASYAPMLEWSARSLLEKAAVCRSISKAKTLSRLIEQSLELPPSEEGTQMRFDLMRLASEFFVPLVDDVLLIAVFEAHAKAKLLRKRYVVHEIQAPSDLAKRQKREPIHVLTIQARHRGNQLVQFKPTTVGLSSLLEPKYRCHYPMSAGAAAGMRSVRQRRNLVHFNTGYAWSLSQELIAFVEHLERVIPKANAAR